MIRALFTLPTLWRYFFSQYAKVFGVTLFAFLVILLTTRLEEFARFVALGSNFISACLFVLFQIPYVMQTALPIASLIASFFLFQKISQTQTLTAIRATGVSLWELICPLLLISSLLALFTFQVILNVSAAAHFQSKKLEWRLRSMNPLSLMHNPKLLAEVGASIEMKGSLQRDGKTEDFIMAIRGSNEGRSALFIAKQMQVKDDRLVGKNLSLVSTLSTGTENHYDHLAIENAKENVILLEDLSRAVNTKRLKVSNDELSFPMLLAKKKDLKAQLDGKKPLYQKESHVEKLYERTCTEIARRISLACACISCAIAGAAFGMTTLKTSSRKRMILLVLLTCVFLLSFL
ncbi:MAG TPA: LptF/LptG family permease, partial [Chlamydiales bacterium]|nr:LptF/LptG family permease [Chlamydiales bacterium]